MSAEAAFESQGQAAWRKPLKVKKRSLALAIKSSHTYMKLMHSTNNTAY